MPFVLIPVHSGLCATLQDYLARVDEGRPLAPAELEGASRLVVLFVLVSQELLDYAAFLAGRPCEN